MHPTRRGFSFLGSSAFDLRVASAAFRRLRRIALSLLAAGPVLTGALMAPQAQAQKVVATLTVGSFPNGAAINPATNTVYIANYTSNTVSVINGATDTVAATITVGTGPINVAVNPDTNTIYVANNSANTVSLPGGPVPWLLRSTPRPTPSTLATMGPAH
jgi:YVTN family beta-propeller protein